MNENEDILKNNKIRIPLYKKFWYSCTKFEKYPEMASEGVGTAIRYLIWLMFTFALIIGIGLLIKFNFIVKQEIQILNRDFSSIHYKDGELKVVTENENVYTNMGNLIIRTDELSQEQINIYENTPSNKPEFIWLKERVIAKIGSKSFSYYYKDILDKFDVNEFDKTTLISYLSNFLNSPKVYLILGIIMILYTFIAYFISTLFGILILSFFGILTTFIAGIKIRYRAIFNMSVYAYTLSTFLQLIYIYIGLFTDFNIKYFDIMYTTIAFICLAAAIFMIKSDVIKQQLELMKIIEIKKSSIENEQEEQPEEKTNEEKDDKNENDDKKDKEKEEKEEKKEKLNTDTQSGEA